MKIVLTLTAFVSLCAVTGGAQQTPMFQTPVYFEDAVGNKDTIVIGYDTTANDEFNPQFGESNITTWFDSVFEVRAVHLLDFGWGQGNYIMTKKIVSGTETALNDTACFYPGSILFFIHCKYQPITIKWSQPVFQGLHCLGASFFTPDRGFRMVSLETWMESPDIRYKCTYFDSTYTLSLGAPFESQHEVPYIAMKPIEGIGVDSIWGIYLQFIIDWYDSPCQFILDAPATAGAGAVPERVRPNPASGLVRIVSAGDVSPEWIGVSDGRGRMVLESSGGGTPLDLSPLPPGMYYYRSRYADGRRGLGKIVKLGP